MLELSFKRKQEFNGALEFPYTDLQGPQGPFSTGTLTVGVDKGTLLPSLENCMEGGLPYKVGAPRDGHRLLLLSAPPPPPPFLSVLL